MSVVRVRFFLRPVSAAPLCGPGGLRWPFDPAESKERGGTWTVLARSVAALIFICSFQPEEDEK